MGKFFACDCGYWWQEDWESHPSCHYDGPSCWAPCEQEHNNYVPDDYYGD